jgi:hypothetical protein
MRVHRPTMLLAVLSACCQPALAAGEHHHPAGAKGVEALSAPLREALSAEMVALQNGLIQVIPAFVAGHWDEVARIGGEMRDSYILKQALSEAQLEELHQALPASFLELDARFHYLAGMLSHAAEAKKPELVGFYLGTMTETCVTCHARHAQSKFPALADAESPRGHDH